MRLYSTLQRGLVELPPPEAGPVRMYFCGPTVYQRAHIGNARPFVLGMWLRSWLRQRGYDVTLVHNITDVNDKIYDAAPGASAELAARATEWYLQDTGDLGLGMPDGLPKATESIPEIVHFIEQLLERRRRVRGRGRRLLPGRARPGLRASLRAAARSDGAGRGAEPAEGGSARFRALEGDQAGRGHRRGTRPWGRGRPGWHIECSAMAEEAFGPVFEIHGGGLDLVFPHHENELAQSNALGHEFARIWTHNGLLEFGGEKMSKSLGNDVSLRNVHRHVGERGRAALLHDGALAQADRLHRRDAAAGEGAGRDLPQLLPRPAGAAAASSWRTSSPRCSTTTSTRPMRSRSSTTGARAANGRRSGRGSRSSASSR